MKTRLLAVLASIALAVTAGATERGQFATTITLEPELGYAFGNTQYQLTYSGLDTSTSTYYGVRSKLVFPIDGLLGGARLRLIASPDPRHRLGVAVGASIPITEPSGDMTDKDWFREIPGPEFLVGFTKSNPKLSGVLISAEGSYGFVNPGKATWDVVAGFRYQRIVQDIDNYTGWYYGADSVGGNEPALYYRVTYVSPSLGLRIVTNSPGRAQFRFEGAFAPTHMSDFDDHLLRKKNSHASGWGIGGLGSAGVKINLGQRSRGITYLDFWGRIFYTTATMTQTQTFYGDDPGTVDDETGLTISDIPYSIRTLQFGLNVRLGFTL